MREPAAISVPEDERVETGRQHEIEIWLVDYNDKYYIVSEHWEQSH